METHDLHQAASELQGYQCLNLTTFRKSGAAVVTTVWFVQDDDAIYAWTAKDSGKMKRIRNNRNVEIAPSTHLGKPCGTSIAAVARTVPVAEQQVPEQLMERKYGWMKRFFALLWRLQGQEHCYIEITPN